MAQDQPQAAPPQTLDSVPPSLRLGLRAAFVQSRMPTTPVVVVVPEERSFIAAVGSWDLDAGVRYPVLIDDGSWAARAAIARFVRAFEPKSVVRWTAPAGAPAWPVSGEPAARQALIEQAAAKPWGVRIAEGGARAAALKKRWDDLKFKPPGLIVTSPKDPAWPAALTLAAARGQPIAWLEGPGTVAGYIAPAEADVFEQQIEALAEASGWTWSELGDDLDAVTLCLNGATKVFLGDAGAGDQRGMLAITDLIGRRVGPPGDKSRRQRWAWTGMIIGNSWSSAYCAMSAVFLHPDSAWLFDGYDDSPPWNAWDATAAGKAFEDAGLTVTVDDNLHRGVAEWRKRAAGRLAARSTDPLPTGPGGVSAGIVCVNTSGNPDFFELKPGLAKPADVPILARPAIVHFVHSWSAASPADARTVAGRWLERGAYAYVGSVHEPYLQAFCPTPKFAQRLIVGLPLGVAARIDNGDLWKINIFGDPLITIGRAQGLTPSPRVEKPLPLQGARDVQAGLAAELKEQRFDAALADLMLLGRDRDAARLLEAALRESQDRISPEAALYGLASCYLAGDFATMLKAYAIAAPRLASEQAVERDRLWDARDMLWHAAYPALASPTKELAELLARSMRTETLQRDAEEAFSAARSAVSPESARAVVARAAGMAANETERKRIEGIGR